MKKFFIVALLLSLVPGSLFFYSWNKVHNQLNIHALEDQSTSPLFKTAQTQYLTKPDGYRLAYWYFPVKNPQAVVILIHGYTSPGGKAQMLDHVEYLRRAGYSTMIPDLRSFGQSDGNKITLGVTEWQDLIALYDHAISLPENKGKKIGYLGVSMGAATAIVAQGLTGKGDFIIASVPFVDINSFFAFRLSNNKFAPLIFPFIKIANYFELGLNYKEFTPQKIINRVNVPILIFSGTRDDSVSSADAGKLFNLANQPKAYWQADAGHNIFGEIPGQFQQHVLDFLKKYAL